MFRIAASHLSFFVFILSAFPVDFFAGGEVVGAATRVAGLKARAAKKTSRHSFLAGLLSPAADRSQAIILNTEYCNFICQLVRNNVLLLECDESERDEIKKNEEVLLNQMSFLLGRIEKVLYPGIDLNPDIPGYDLQTALQYRFLCGFYNSSISVSEADYAVESMGDNGLICSLHLAHEAGKQVRFDIELMDNCFDDSSILFMKRPTLRMSLDVWEIVKHDSFVMHSVNNLFEIAFASGPNQMMDRRGSCELNKRFSQALELRNYLLTQVALNSKILERARPFVLLDILVLEGFIEGIELVRSGHITPFGGGRLRMKIDHPVEKDNLAVFTQFFEESCEDMTSLEELYEKKEYFYEHLRERKEYLYGQILVVRAFFCGLDAMEAKFRRLAVASRSPSFVGEVALSSEFCLEEGVAQNALKQGGSLRAKLDRRILKREITAFNAGASRPQRTEAEAARACAELLADEEAKKKQPAEKTPPPKKKKKKKNKSSPISVDSTSVDLKKQPPKGCAAQSLDAEEADASSESVSAESSPDRALSLKEENMRRFEQTCEERSQEAEMWWQQCRGRGLVDRERQMEFHGFIAQRRQELIAQKAQERARRLAKKEEYIASLAAIAGKAPEKDLDFLRHAFAKGFVDALAEDPESDFRTRKEIVNDYVFKFVSWADFDEICKKVFTVTSLESLPMLNDVFGANNFHNPIRSQIAFQLGKLARIAFEREFTV
ncbi:hypothetical protein FJ366_04160 [Candidatus Dependentiae bacterium]|nr:hypothetical protein [Candidatus Dependentiae bacterium]